MSDEHDPKKKSSRYDPSRRKFLKGVGVAGAGAALADHFISADTKIPAAESVTTGEPIAGTVSIALDVNGDSKQLGTEHQASSVCRREVDLKTYPAVS